MTRLPVVAVIAFATVGCGEEMSREIPPIRGFDSMPERLAPTKGTLRGIWWSADQPQSAAFEIGDTTISYPDMFTEFKYEVKGDTLLVHRDDGPTPSVIVRLTPDSLILLAHDQRSAYTRAEPRKP